MTTSHATPTSTPQSGAEGDDARFDYDVAVVGLGYVGLPTALAYHAGGSRVLAVDPSADRLVSIGAGLVDLISSDQERLSAAITDDRFQLTAVPAALSRARAVIVCVPTPVDTHFVPDLTALRGACTTVVELAVPGQLLMLTSTTYVGCTEDLLVKPLVHQGFHIGEDIFVAFSAALIDPGSETVAQEIMPRVVGGASQACEDRAAETLAGYARYVHRVPSLEIAETTKLLEHTFRAVNIALANEFADICRSLDINMTHVIEAASTNPFGFMAFTPGPGVGGPCVPSDPHYLLWQLRKDRVKAPVIAEAMQQIATRPAKVIERIREVLWERRVTVAGARILVVGVAYKSDVADVRDSPALEIMQMLHDLDASVGYVDPQVDEIQLANGLTLNPVSRPDWSSPSLVLLHTPHTATDLSWLAPGQLVLDATSGRLNVLDPVSL